MRDRDDREAASQEDEDLIARYLGSPKLGVHGIAAQDELQGWTGSPSRYGERPGQRGEPVRSMHLIPYQEGGRVAPTTLPYGPAGVGRAYDQEGSDDQEMTNRYGAASSPYM